MTREPPGASDPAGLVAGTLYDIAQSFDWPLDPEPRLRRALRLLRRIVPYDRCGLFDTPAAGAPRLVVGPDAAEEHAGMSRILRRFLTELHGGSLDAHSEGEGRGSEFVVRVPVGAPS